MTREESDKIAADAAEELVTKNARRYIKIRRSTDGSVDTEAILIQVEHEYYTGPVFKNYFERIQGQEDRDKLHERHCALFRVIAGSLINFYLPREKSFKDKIFDLLGL